MVETRYERGMAVRRRVLGDRHVDEASARSTNFDDDFQTFITEGAWGSLWSRPGLTLRERSMLTGQWPSPPPCPRRRKLMTWPVLPHPQVPVSTSPMSSVRRKPG